MRQYVRLCALRWLSSSVAEFRGRPRVIPKPSRIVGKKIGALPAAMRGKGVIDDLLDHGDSKPFVEMFWSQLEDGSLIQRTKTLVLQSLKAQNNVKAAEEMVKIKDALMSRSLIVEADFSTVLQTVAKQLGAEKGLALLEEMISAGIQPKRRSFTPIIQAGYEQKQAKVVVHCLQIGCANGIEFTSPDMAMCLGASIENDDRDLLLAVLRTMKKTSTRKPLLHPDDMQYIYAHAEGLSAASLESVSYLRQNSHCPHCEQPLEANRIDRDNLLKILAALRKILVLRGLAHYVNSVDAWLDRQGPFHHILDALNLTVNIVKKKRTNDERDLQRIISLIRQSGESCCLVYPRVAARCFYRYRQPHVCGLGTPPNIDDDVSLLYISLKSLVQANKRTFGRVTTEDQFRDVRLELEKAGMDEAFQSWYDQQVFHPRKSNFGHVSISRY